MGNSSQVKSSPRQIHFICRKASLDAARRIFGVFGITSVPEDSYEAGVGTWTTFVDDTKLRGLYDNWIIELRFKSISLKL